MIDDEVRRVALSARSEYESARANEAALAASLEKLKGGAITTNEAMVSLRELERDVLAGRAVYEAFLVRARETGEQERLDTKNIRVISRAEVPLRRSFPPSSLLLAMAGTLFGIAAGSGMVIVRELYDVQMPRTSGIGVGTRAGAAAGALGGKLFETITQFWPSIKLSSPPLPVLAVLPNVDVSFGLDAAEEFEIALCH